jgi:centromeric protein E
MSKMLDEMIQDRVESGAIIRGTRGSMRVASSEGRDRNNKEASPPLPPPSMPLPPPPVGPPPSSSPPPAAAVVGPPIQLQLLSRQRASFISEQPQKPLALEV